MGRKMGVRFARRGVMLALFLFVSAAATHYAHAQALPTASKTVGLSVFAAGSRLNTDYGSAGNGFILGADASRPFRGFETSLEFRYGHGGGDTVTESTYEGGLKLSKPLGESGRFRPYGEIQLGYGVIDFKHPIIYPTGPYASDNSTVYGLGGGAEYGLPAHLALKGDFQYEFWKLGTESNGLTPYAVSAGIVYRIPLRPFRR